MGDRRSHRHSLKGLILWARICSIYLVCGQGVLPGVTASFGDVTIRIGNSHAADPLYRVEALFVAVARRAMRVVVTMRVGATRIEPVTEEISAPNTSLSPRWPLDHPGKQKRNNISERKKISPASGAFHAIYRWANDAQQEDRRCSVLLLATNQLAQSLTILGAVVSQTSIIWKGWGLDVEKFD
jgi:hypothetical protein